MYSTLKSFLSPMISPTFFITVLFFTGGYYLYKNKTKQFKHIYLLVIGIFILFTINPIADSLLFKYERLYSHSPYQGPGKIKYIVILAGGHTPTKNLPLTSELTEQTLIRLVEGIRLKNKYYPKAKIIVTGKGHAQKTEAVAMKELALDLGVNPKEIIVEEKSTNTWEHTQNLKKILKQTPFILVTSALHMPRAIALFKKEKLNAHAAPTQHLLQGTVSTNLFPRGENLYALDALSYEIKGLIMALIKGQISL
ncbi:MAG: YdcF family protein [Bacteriovoracaceae bacterium]|nr:hypothetical protein [Halobacteriovoraceae bacterium]MDP7319976.1 YdcF family protein [Bacteriovoracaceae bacterium]